MNHQRMNELIGYRGFSKCVYLAWYETISEPCPLCGLSTANWQPSDQNNRISHAPRSESDFTNVSRTASNEHRSRRSIKNYSSKTRLLKRRSNIGTPCLAWETTPLSSAAVKSSPIGDMEKCDVVSLGCFHLLLPTRRTS